MRNVRGGVRQFASLLIVATCSLTSVGAAAQVPGTFRPAGAMSVGRSSHAAVVLLDGTVLLAGEGSAEIYEPATGLFTPAATFQTLRRPLTATLLDDGRVLITGLSTVRGTRSAELYDPATRSFSPTGSRASEGLGIPPVHLKNGKVLFVDGVPELYDPATGTFSIAPGERSSGSTFISAATLLADGTVLIAALPTSEVYDPEAGTYTRVEGRISVRKLEHTFHPAYISELTLTLLPNGQVLLVGGHHEDLGRFLDAQLYDPATNTFIATGAMSRPRAAHAATLLPDGRVLITGGESEVPVPRGWAFSGTEASAEIYNPRTGTFAATGRMGESRAGHASTLLPTGEVLISGGYFYSGPGRGTCCSAGVEIFTPLHERRRRSVRQ